MLTHALFKALLFICAGGVVHSIGDSQDIHFMVGLLQQVLTHLVCHVYLLP